MSENEKMARMHCDCAVALNMRLSDVATYPLQSITDAECRNVSTTTIFSFEELRAFYPAPNA